MAENSLTKTQLNQIIKDMIALPEINDIKDLNDDDLKYVLKHVLIKYMEDESLSELSRFFENTILDTKDTALRNKIGAICYQYVPAETIFINKKATCLSMDTITQTDSKILTKIFQSYNKNKDKNNRKEYSTILLSFICFNFRVFDLDIFKKENTPIIYNIDWTHSQITLSFLERLNEYRLLKYFDLPKLCERLVDTYYKDTSHDYIRSDYFKLLYDLFSSYSEEAILVLLNKFKDLIITNPSLFLSHKGFKVTPELILYVYTSGFSNKITIQQSESVLKSMVKYGKISQEELDGIIERIKERFYPSKPSNHTIEFDDDEI